MKKTVQVNPEYEKIVDEILAEHLPVQDALIQIFERCYGVSVTTLKKTNEKNKKSNKRN